MNQMDGLQVNGPLICQAVVLPDGAVTDSEVADLAGIDTTKLRHQYLATYRQVSTANAAVDRQVVHVCHGAGTIEDVAVGAVTAGLGGATATIDVLQNGTSILSAPISLTSSTASFALLAGLLASTPTDVSAGDVIEVSVTGASAGGGTLAKGLFARIMLREDFQ